MVRVSVFVMLAAALLTLPGCKIVYDTPEDEAAIPDGPEGDDARNAARLDATFETQLLPLIRDNAVPVDQLRGLVAADLDAAGEAHANRGAGQGAAWNFAVSGAGVVTAARLDTRARSLDLDTDADGTADVTVQLGPVVRGTTLRDAAPFYNFDEFRDQIEFAKLARALNDQLPEMIEVPEGDLLGLSASFVGVTPLKSAGEAIVVTPIELQFQP